MAAGERRPARRRRRCITNLYYQPAAAHGTAQTRALRLPQSRPELPIIHLGRYPILGVGVNAIDYDAAVAEIVTAAADGRSLALTCTAVHGVMVGALDRGHRHRLNTFDVIVPDGQPVRWALGWLHGIRLADRVRGVDLMHRLCERCALEGLPIFLYGSTPRVLENLRANLLRQFPTLVVAGARPSAFRAVTEEERVAIAHEIRSSGCQVVLVGLGCPRQEYWIFENRELLELPLVGIGSAFDALAGLQSVPPMWMQRSGLEWLWRLAHEPARLWRRYLLLNPLYLLLVAAQKLGLAELDRGAHTPPDATMVG